MKKKLYFRLISLILLIISSLPGYSANAVSDNNAKLSVFEVELSRSDIMNLSALSGGTISGAATICYNNVPEMFDNLASASGGTGVYTYSWEKSTTSSSSGYSAISGATDLTYTSPALTITTYFRRKVVSGTSSAYSNYIKVTVYAELTAGTIGNAQTLCSGTSANTLTELTAPTGGSGTYTYQWQQSTDNHIWTSITGATSSSYSPGVLTSTTYYRRNVTGGVCGSVIGLPVTITVYPELNPGSVGSAQSICQGGTPSTLTELIAASGGRGTYSYQWQTSSDNSAWTDITGATSTTYSPGALISTTYFRRKVTNLVCGSAFTVSVKITINDQISAGEIYPSQTICKNTAPQAILQRTPPLGGSGTYTFQWQLSYDNTTWTDISGATQSTYTPGIISLNTYFRRKVTSGDCGTAFSLPVLISVYNLTGGAIGSDQAINCGGVPSIITNITAPSGGNGSLTYLWYTSSDKGLTWKLIADATDETYQPDTLKITTSFKRAVSDLCNSEAFSNVVTITVLAKALPDGTKNFIYTVEPNAEVSDTSALFALPNGYVKQSITYFDGLGLNRQNISIFGNPDCNDVVTPIVYDNFGRKQLEYLPYYTESVNSGSYIEADTVDQKNLYNNIYPGETSYSKTVYESSPLNRVIERGAPGDDWQPGKHSTRFEYKTNSSSEVRRWIVRADDHIITTGFYSKGTLFKNIVKDENWTSGQLNTTEEFKDIKGNVVLKRSYVLVEGVITSVETYYIYDGFNLLRYVLTPKAVQKLESQTELRASSPLIRNLCYYYQYDDRKRMILKQLPGAGPVQMVYDQRDRLAATQDSVQKSSGKWLITKYDSRNRPVMTALKSIPDTRSVLQSYFDSYAPGNQYFESRTSSGIGYTLGNSLSTKLTLTESDLLSVIYYDVYDYPGAKSFNDTIRLSSYHNSASGKYYFEQTEGLVTGTRSKVLDGNENSSSGYRWLVATTYYDDRYRAIEVINDLYSTNPGDNQTTSSLYDFAGKLLKTRVRQNFRGQTNTLCQVNKYDSADRLTQSGQQVNSVTDTVILASMRYNGLGQLTEKALYGETGNGLQEIFYSYNIRGWLEKINDPSTNPSSSSTTKFNMQLYYNSLPTGFNVSKQYNGNIAAMVWNTPKNDDAKSPASKQGYEFTYDGLNRVSGSVYGEGVSLADSLNANNERCTYDLNGNILSLVRRRRDTGFIDKLSYTYKNSGASNLLDRIDDASVATGFNNGISSENEYTFDGNGNLISDLNKGYTSILYNYLNLPRRVGTASQHISYIYDANGTKLAKVSTSGAYTYYTGSFVYENSALSYIHNSEGMFVPGSGYKFYLRDHLGNTRMLISTSGSGGTVEQQTDYYPFGMKIASYDASVNKYLYNGKEIQDDVIGSTKLEWYDYGARFYDPQIGRWTTPDPLSEVNRKWSPYRYAYDNPLRFLDPDGMLEELYINGNEEAAKKATEELQKSTTLALSRDGDTGKITATGEAKTIEDKALLDVINSESIDVCVTATNGAQTSDGSPMIGGSFMGNGVTKTETGNSVVANQEVNPYVLSRMSSLNGAPGQDMLHEVTEAYEGAKISQTSGVSSPNSNEKGTVYKEAHNLAIPQTGIMVENLDAQTATATYSTTPMLKAIGRDPKDLTDLKPVLKINVFEIQ